MFIASGKWFLVIYLSSTKKVQCYFTQFSLFLCNVKFCSETLSVCGYHIFLQMTQSVHFYHFSTVEAFWKCWCIWNFWLFYTLVFKMSNKCQTLNYGYSWFLVAIFWLQELYIEYCDTLWHLQWYIFPGVDLGRPRALTLPLIPGLEAPKLSTFGPCLIFSLLFLPCFLLLLFIISLFS